MSSPARVARLVPLLVTAVAVCSAFADETPYPLGRLTGPIVVDGRPDEEAWQALAPLPLTMYTPVFRGTPTQRTEIRAGYDDESLLVAGWFYDTDPPGIRINSLYRDRWNGDDALAIYVDAFNDDRNAKWFGVTPAGMRFDTLISDDGESENSNWDAFWSAEARVTDQGWFVEVRIPFSTLGFRPSADGRAVMGLTVTRLVSRLQERVTFPAVDPKFSFRRPSVAQDVLLEGVRSRTPLYVTPYVLAGRDRHAAGGNPLSIDRAHEVGLDARYPLSSQLTLDLTANTDFAQVEADDQQIALDRFPLFYPERRRFFQEDSGLFEFTSAGGGRLFHSRRIGLADDGTPVRILGGARLVGRAGAWELGALDMQTDADRGRSGENFGVLRVRRPVLNQWSTIGMLLTSYQGENGNNVALGADALLRVRGDDYLGLKWAATADERERSGANLADRSLVDVKWDRRTGRGLAYTGQFTRAGRDYDPALGFMPRSDFTTANLSGNWFVFTDRNRYFRRVFPGVLAFATFRNRDRKLESGQYAFWVQWETKSGGGGWLEPKWFREDVVVPFTIGGKVNVPAGRYDFADFQAVYTMGSGARLRANVDARAGTYFDGRRTQVVVSPTWNASAHLEVGGDYQMTALDFGARREEATIHLVRLRVRGAIDARTSGNTLIQYNSTTGRVDFNVRFRHNLAEGSDLWFVYNESLDADRERDLPGVPRLQPLSLTRAVILKYTHTFTVSR